MISFAVIAVLGLALLPGAIQSAYAQQAKPEAAPAAAPITKSLGFSDKEADLIRQIVRERRIMPQKEVEKEELELPPDPRPVERARAKPEEANANLPQARGQAVMPMRTMATLHLPAIMYFNPKKWTIWLNGAMITPDRVPHYLEGIEVGSNSVELSLRRGAGLEPITVRLRANETYIIGTGEVIQGPPPPPAATEGKDDGPAVPQTPYVPPPPPPQPAATAKTTESAESSSDVEAAVGAAEKALSTLKALTTGGATSGSK